MKTMKFGIPSPDSKCGMMGMPQHQEGDRLMKGMFETVAVVVLCVTCAASALAAGSGPQTMVPENPKISAAAEIAAVTAVAQQKYGGQGTRNISVTPVNSQMLADAFPGTTFHNVRVHTFTLGIEQRSNYCAAYREGKISWAYENLPAKPGCPPLSDAMKFCKELKADDAEAALKATRILLELARMTIIDDPSKAPKVGNTEPFDAPRVATIKDEVSGEDIFRVTVYVIRDSEINAVSRFEFDVLKGGGLQQNFHGVREVHIGSQRARL
jgi:hypothetical protein